MDIPHWLLLPKFNWIPPLTLSVLILLGLLFGFMNGWKSALYFMSVNALALFIGLLTFKEVWINEAVPRLLRIINAHQKVLNEQELSSLLKTPVLLFYLTTLLAFSWVVSLIPYIFLRKYFKKQIKINKGKKASNIKARIGGSTIGVLTALPYAAFVTTMAAATLAPSHRLTNSFNTLSNVFTLGETKTLIQDVEDTLGLLGLISDTSKTTSKTNEIKKAFENLLPKKNAPGKTITKEQIIEDLTKNKAAIKAFIRRPQLVDSVINNINKGHATPIIDKKTLNDNIKKIKGHEKEVIKRLDEAGISVSPEQLEKLINAFKPKP